MPAQAAGLLPGICSRHDLSNDAGLSKECAAFLARNFQDVPQEQLPASFDPKLTLLQKQFRHAYTYSGKTSAAGASWQAVA